MSINTEKKTSKESGSTTESAGSFLTESLSERRSLEHGEQKTSEDNKLMEKYVRLYITARSLGCLAYAAEMKNRLLTTRTMTSLSM
jgi:hypothetical protein